MANSSMVWADAIVLALRTLGGEAHLSRIYEETRKVREAHKQPLSKTWPHTIRRTLQESEYFVQDEKGSGVWRLIDSMR